MKSIGILGMGFVGTAVAEGMKHAYTVYGYDVKRKGVLTKITKSEKCELGTYNQDGLEKLLKIVDGPIFICVPTPMKEDGSADISIVKNAISSVVNNDNYQKNLIVIKSTIPPGTTAALSKEFKNPIVFNPEFLTEANSIEDFKNQDRIIFGGPKPQTIILKILYQKAYPNVPTIKTSSHIAEMVKYVTNTFLATKVAYANEIYKICQAFGEDIDFDKVIEYSTRDKRLGVSHWSVPGPDGKFGFGGKCFCKDLNALISTAENLGVEANLLKSVWDQNLKIRPKRDWEEIPGVLTKEDDNE